MYLHRTPFWAKHLFPSYTWKINEKAKYLYLTFDDGPVPGATEFVLDQLKLHQAKATFFCVGENVEKHPEVFKKIVAEGHRVGNHTFNHLNGWKTDNAYYVENVKKCAGVLKKHTNQPLDLFRPPYGKIKSSQARLLTKEYEIIMWEVLSGDFDKKIRKEDCLSKSVAATKSGSIIIFHDSIKAEENLRFVLPKFLKHFTDAGFQFRPL